MEEMNKSAEMSLNYSKKQINPLIEKFKIIPERNTKFKDIITMFDNQTNYQVWAIKAVFNRYITMDTLVYIKNWAEKYHQLVSKLQKKNIVAYTTPEAVSQMLREMQGLEMFAIVKRNIEKFNTDQRDIIAKNIGKVNDGIQALDNNLLKMLYDYFGAFEKFTEKRQQLFITKCSSVRDFHKFLKLLQDCINDAWEWNHDEFVNFVNTVTPNAKIVYDKQNIVIVLIKDYESCQKICGGTKSSWCITTSHDQFNSYCLNNGRKQFAFFDFNTTEDNSFAMIGFTLESDNRFYCVQDKRNNSILSSGNFDKIMAEHHISMHDILKVNLDYMPYSWDKKSLLNFVKDNSNECAIILDKDNLLIIKPKNRDIFARMTKHTFLNVDKICDFDNAQCYLIFNFNESADGKTAITSLITKKDEYGTESIVNCYDIVNSQIEKQALLKSLHLRESEFISNVELDANVLLHKYVDECNEEDAIALIETHKDLDINYKYNSRLAITIAIANAMGDLVVKMINNPKFDATLTDIYNEPAQNLILMSLLFDQEEKKPQYEKMLHALVDSNKANFNQQAMNKETTLMVSVTNPSINWFSKWLIDQKDIDINAVSEFNETALSEAMIYNNTEIISYLGQRPDLVISENDKIIAKSCNIDLNELIKPNPNFFEERDNKAKNATKGNNNDDTEVSSLSEDEKEIFKRIKHLMF